MPTLNNPQSVSDPTEQVVEFIQARFPGEPLGMQTQGLIVQKLEMETLSVEQFDTLVVDLKIAFPQINFDGSVST